MTVLSMTFTEVNKLFICEVILLQVIVQNRNFRSRHQLTSLIRYQSKVILLIYDLSTLVSLFK